VLHNPCNLQVLAEQSANAEEVMQRMVHQNKHVYAKQMGKFISVIKRSWLKDGVHIVRSPI
jgi:hypothetical protein